MTEQAHRRYFTINQDGTIRDCDQEDEDSFFMEVDVERGLLPPEGTTKAFVFKHEDGTLVAVVAMSGVEVKAYSYQGLEDLRGLLETHGHISTQVDMNKGDP